MMDFTKISYLQFGTEKQKQVYQLLTEHQILNRLHQYSPILVGTIPIDIDIANSDLDIICHVSDGDRFKEHLTAVFASEKGFKLTENDNYQSVKANFIIDEFEIEIFGQNCPTLQQNGYRHMLIEYQLLQEKGESFKQEIIGLKQLGYKTEPAFAKLLGLNGDPYEALLHFRLKKEN